MGGKVQLLFNHWLFCCLSLCFVLLTLGTSSSVRALETDIWEATIPDPQSWWITIPSVFDPADLQTTKHKWNLSWIATDDIMPYITFSKGYKTGNVNRSDGKALTPEFLTSWEFGLKSRFFNNRLQVNMGAYYFEYKNQTSMDYYDYIYNRSVALSPGGTKQQGVSANIMWMITRNDILMLYATKSINQYKDYDIQKAMLAAYPDSDSWKRNFNRDLSVEKFGGPIRANLGYTHTQFIGTNMLMLTGNLFYTATAPDQIMWRGDPDLYYMPGLDDYYTADVSANYTSSWGMPPGHMWHLRFYCNNVVDSDHLSSIYYSDSSFMVPGTLFAAGTGTIGGSYLQPRTYGITFGLNW